MEHLNFDMIVTSEVLHLSFLYSMYLNLMPVRPAYNCPSEKRFG